MYGARYAPPISHLRCHGRWLYQRLTLLNLDPVVFFFFSKKFNSPQNPSSWLMSFNWFFSTYTVFFIPKDKTCLQGIIGLTALPGKNTLEILRIFSINVSLDYSVMSEVWECSDLPFYHGNPIPTLCYCMRYFNNLHTIFPLFLPYGVLTIPTLCIVSRQKYQLNTFS